MVIVVYGDPAPQGSKRFVRTSAAGKGIMIESSKKVAPWREAVKYAALEVRAGGAAIAGAVQVRMVFTFRKTKAAAKRGDARPYGKPDLSKLLRSTEDALTDAGVWTDDARVVEYVRAAKVFVGEDPEALDAPGVRIWIGTSR